MNFAETPIQSIHCKNQVFKSGLTRWSARYTIINRSAAAASFNPNDPDVRYVPIKYI